MNTGLVLLEIAKKDLEAAKCLFEKGLYPQAIFYLEQAVEKATKSLAIYNKMKTEKELKENVRHETQKIYLDILKQSKVKVERTYELIKRFPRLKQASLIKELGDLNVNRLNNIIENFVFFIDGVKFISKEELQEIISEAAKFEKEIENTEIKIEESEIKNLKERLLEFVDLLCEINPAVPEKIKGELERKFELFTPELVAALLKHSINLISCFNSLLYLSVILCPHAIRSRYPDNGFNPLETYTEGFPLVENFGPLASIVEKVLDKITGLFSENLFEKIEGTILQKG